MILPIGSNRKPYRKIKKRGLTFIEVMVTLSILSLGVIAIFKSYVLSIDRMNHLTNRLYMTTIIDNRLSKIERMLRIYRTLPTDIGSKDAVDVGGRQLSFEQTIGISAVEDYLDIFQLDVGIGWTEGERNIKLSRSTYISDFYKQ